MKKIIIISMLLSLFTQQLFCPEGPAGEAEGTEVTEEQSHEKEQEEQNEARKSIAEKAEERDTTGSQTQKASTTATHTADPESGAPSDAGGLAMSPETSSDASQHEATADKPDSTKPTISPEEAQVQASDFISSKNEEPSTAIADHQDNIQSLNDEISSLKSEIEQKPWHEKVMNWVLKLFNALPADSAEQKLADKQTDVESRQKDIENKQKQIDFIKQVAEELTPEQLADKDVQTVVEEYLKLPSKARPESIKIALEKMKSGEAVRNAIKTGDFSQVTGIKDILNDKSIAEADKTTLTKLLTNKAVTDAELESLRSSKDYEKIKQTYLRTVVDLQWDIYKQAMLDNAGFASGMVTIPDPSENVMNVMENYVKLVNPHFDASGTSLASLTNNEGYNRSGKVSSHWKGMVEGKRIYGIDVRFDGEYVKDLPGNKQQLHFGRLTNGDTFIKWEYHGTTIRAGDASLVEHAFDYKQTQAMKKEGVNDKNTAFRKEHVLDSTKTAFEEAMGDAYDGLTKEQERQIKNEGISAMVKILQARADAAVGTSAEATAQENLDSFKTKLTKQGYTEASLASRKGNEVQLPPGLFEAAPTSSSAPTSAT